MAKKNSYLTCTDLFCGAGGSSQGAQDAGVEVKLALNHWNRAIETHQTNFPDTDHDCTDISACDPRRYRSTDIAIMSPECTNHSLAKGQKQVKKQLDLYDKGVIDPSADRSRATMWDVPRFAEYHKYEVVIVENVVDARKWVMFDAWLHAMHSLGYNHKCVYLNSMHCHPTPQSRDRMYVVFWKKGNAAPVLDYMPKSHCGHCGKDVEGIQTWKNKQMPFGKYKQQYVYCCPTCSKIVEPYYYAAFNCIDWSDKGKRIGDRDKPLSPNTTKRITYGLEKFGCEHPILPFIVNDQQSTGINHRVKSTVDKLATVPTQPHFKLIMPLIIKGEHSQQLNVRSSSESMVTQCTRQTMSMVVPPFIVENKGTSLARQTTQPLGCATGINYHGIVTNEAWNSFIGYYYGQAQYSLLTEAIGTATTKERHFIVNYQKPSIADCYYRMLKPHEIKLAMAFANDYVVTGSGKDQVKQLGNAVTPPAMKWLIQQCVNSLS